MSTDTSTLTKTLEAAFGRRYTVEFHPGANPYWAYEGPSGAARITIRDFIVVDHWEQEYELFLSDGHRWHFEQASTSQRELAEIAKRRVS